MVVPSWSQSCYVKSGSLLRSRALLQKEEVFPQHFGHQILQAALRLLGSQSSEDQKGKVSQEMDFKTLPKGRSSGDGFMEHKDKGGPCSREQER